MKKYRLIPAFIALALVMTSCSLPFEIVPVSNDVPQENFPAENLPPEGLPPEEQPPEGIPPQDQPPEEHPGEAQIGHFLAHRVDIRSGECTILEWGVQGATEVTLNGERVDQGGIREVCPPETTSYRLTARAGEQVLERDVTVNVVQENQGNPPTQPTQQSAPPQPAPKPTKKHTSSNKGPTVTPTPAILIAQLDILDLGVNQIYSAASGKIMIRIRNAGTVAVKNNIKVSCQALYQPGDYFPPFQNKTITINLAPGQTADYETGYYREPKWTSQVVSCQITPPVADTYSKNNALNNVKVK